MKNNKVTCRRCGSKSFRYSVKRKKSYCVVCGLEIDPKRFEEAKK